MIEEEWLPNEEDIEWTNVERFRLLETKRKES